MKVDYQNLWIQSWVSIGLFLIFNYLIGWQVSWAWFAGLAGFQAFKVLWTRRKKST